jgi:hypothetical protein
MAAIQHINPFTPGKRLTRPDVFSGRTRQLMDSWRLLLQAGAHNARHALITGDRGIGKRSLSSQIQGLARADRRYIDLLGRVPATQPQQFLVVEHIAQRNETLPDLSDALIDALERARNKLRAGVLSGDPRGPHADLPASPGAQGADDHRRHRRHRPRQPPSRT